MLGAWPTSDERRDTHTHTLLPTPLPSPSLCLSPPSRSFCPLSSSTPATPPPPWTVAGGAGAAGSVRPGTGGGPLYRPSKSVQGFACALPAPFCLQTAAHTFLGTDVSCTSSSTRGAVQPLYNSLSATIHPPPSIPRLLLLLLGGGVPHSLQPPPPRPAHPSAQSEWSPAAPGPRPAGPRAAGPHLKPPHAAIPFGGTWT